MSTLVLRHRPPTLGGVRLRLDVALHRRALDAALAGGVSPAAEPALALRAQQLSERPTREALATTLLDVLAAAEKPPSTWGRGDPRPPLRRDAVLAARPELLALAERLSGPREVSPRALASAAQLAWESASPIYAGESVRSVADFARAILELQGAAEAELDLDGAVAT
jgi:hypothetical protein